MLRIAVCDDHEEELAVCASHIHRYLTETGKEAAVKQFHHPDDLLVQAEKEPFHLYLLDVIMPMVNGIEVGLNIRSLDQQAQIIYLTTSREFAVDAYAVNAAHYLVKPYTEAAFHQAMDRAMAKLENVMYRTIQVKQVGGGLLSVDISDIRYIESQGHVQCLYLKNATATEANRSLSRLGEMLEEQAPGQFVSPYKGLIVNLAAIRSLDSSRMVLMSGEALPIAKRSYRTLKDQFFDFCFKDTSR